MRSFAARRSVAIVAALVLGSGLSTAACSDDDSDGTDITQKIEDGAEDAGDEIKDGAEDAKDDLEDGADEVKDGAEDAKDEVKDGAEDMNDDEPNP